MAGRVGMVLSGGGSKGDFEVGALRFLYETGIRPDVVAGSSVGAINALKLAEGDGEPGSQNAQQRLEAIWRDLRTDKDMYEREPWLETIHDLRIQDLLVEGFGVQGSSAVASWLKLPALAISGLISSGLDLQAVSDAFNKATKARSIYNLNPVERLIRNPEHLDLDRVAGSGIALRISVVGLESGKLRHVNERGEISGVDADPVSLIDAAVASASIPMMFPPRRLGEEHYVDGGVREILPILPVVQAGATEVYAITASQASLPVDDFSEETLVGIGLRAVGDLMIDEVTEGDIRKAVLHGRDVKLTVIRPTVDVHNVIEIEPGLIDISIDYGYMRTADQVAVEDGDRADAMRLSDAITLARMECWQLENSIVRDRQRVLLTPGDRTTLTAIRSLKRRVHELHEERLALGAPLPDDAARWWNEWEQHIEGPPRFSPWERTYTAFGPLPDETPPGSA